MNIPTLIIGSVFMFLLGLLWFKRVIAYLRFAKEVRQQFEQEVLDHVSSLQHGSGSPQRPMSTRAPIQY
jgi:hypothetical protein